MLFQGDGLLIGTSSQTIEVYESENCQLRRRIGQLADENQDSWPYQYEDQLIAINADARDAYEADRTVSSSQVDCVSCDSSIGLSIED